MKKLRYRAENSPQAWLYLLPALIIIGVFNVLPLIKTFIMSMQKGTLNNLQFNGFKNFQVVLQDPKFHDAIGNTALFSFIVVPVGLIISMFIAITIFEKIKYKSLFETIFFIPYLTSVIAIGIVFRYLLNKDRFKAELTEDKYVVGIRPEYFVNSKNPLFNVDIETVELIGKDCILNFKANGVNSKSIVDVNDNIRENDNVGFDIDYNGIYLFQENGVRVY